MKRGDLYLARLEPAEGTEQRGTRPVVIVSRDSLNDSTGRVTAVPFTTHRGRRVARHQARLSARPGGLAVESVALCEQLRVLDKLRLLRPLGALTDDEMIEIDRALEIALALDAPPRPR